MTHRPRKRFGQNFLQSPHVIDAILKAIQPKQKDNILEIGPGLGALTEPLLKQVHALTAIEIDTDLQAKLKQMPHANRKLNLIAADALSIDYSEFGEQLRVIGNLPYNISTPLIIHLLHYIGFIEDMHFMLQKEVVDRIAASPGTKAYGRLSVMVQYYCTAESLFTVPADAFYPKPKVESAVIRLTPYATLPYPYVDFSDLERLVAQAFSMRRKTLANNLKPLLHADEIKSLNINPALRPEQISVSEYAQIAKFVTK